MERKQVGTVTRAAFDGQSYRVEATLFAETLSRAWMAGQQRETPNVRQLPSGAYQRLVTAPLRQVKANAYYRPLGVRQAHSIYDMADVDFSFDGASEPPRAVVKNTPSTTTVDCTVHCVDDTVTGLTVRLNGPAPWITAFDQLARLTTLGCVSPRLSDVLGCPRLQDVHLSWITVPHHDNVRGLETLVAKPLQRISIEALEFHVTQSHQTNIRRVATALGAAHCSDLTIGGMFLTGPRVYRVRPVRRFRRASYCAMLYRLVSNTSIRRLHLPERDSIDWCPDASIRHALVRFLTTNTSMRVLTGVPQWLTGDVRLCLATGHARGLAVVKARGVVSPMRCSFFQSDRLDQHDVAWQCIVTVLAFRRANHAHAFVDTILQPDLLAVLLSMTQQSTESEMDVGRCGTCIRCQDSQAIASRWSRRRPAWLGAFVQSRYAQSV